MNPSPIPPRRPGTNPRTGGSLVVERCPNCQSDRIIVFAGSERRRFLCADCGTRWTRDGANVKDVMVGRVSPDHPTVVAKAPPNGDLPRRAG